MKAREAFLASFGSADEAFARHIRQTVTSLQQKEETVVKKKMSVGFVFAAAMLLICATALAVGAWGIADHLAESGIEMRPYQLISDVPQRVSENDAVDIVIEEALCDGEKFYMTVRFAPKQPGTLIVPHESADNAQPDGFERVVSVSRIAGYPMDGEAAYVRCENLPDGSLRVLMEGKAAAGTQTYPGMLIPARWYVIAYAEDGERHQIELTADIPMRVNGLGRRSAAADAHDLANAKGTIRWIAVERTEQGYAYFTMLVDGLPEAGGMFMPYAQLVGEDGEVLHELNCSRSFLVSTSGEQYLCGLPSAYADLDRMTIRLLDFSTGEIYDEHTYTME